MRSIGWGSRFPPARLASCNCNYSDSFYAAIFFLRRVKAMGEHADKMRSHGVFGELSKSQEMLAIVAPAASGNPQALDALERLQLVIEYLGSAFKQSDPALLTPGVLETARNALKAVRGEMQNYLNNKELRHLQEANNKLDGVVPSTFGLPVPYKQQGLDEISGRITEQRKRLDADGQKLAEQLRGLAAEIKKLQETTKAVTGDINQQKPRLDTAIADFQRQFSDSQAVRQAEFSSAERARLESHAATLKEITDSHKTESDARQQKFESWSAGTSKHAADMLSKIDANARYEIEQITQLHADAEKIVGLIGEHGMVHGYQAQANSARVAFRFWSGTAVGALLCWILFGLVAFWYTYDKELSWATVARQFLVSTPFLLLATFGGYQAFVHQRATSQFRQRELEIASLDPFLASLTRAESNEIKREMVAKFFGGQSHSDNVPLPPDLAGTALGIIDRLTAAADKK
ncbi:MAG TPA: hypothetical protein VJV39_19270 [Dongiaceae bacterium]|nr:hypothetical protein [Dongiaceae bacterium]